MGVRECDRTLGRSLSQANGAQFKRPRDDCDGCWLKMILMRAIARERRVGAAV